MPVINWEDGANMLEAPAKETIIRNMVESAGFTIELLALRLDMDSMCYWVNVDFYLARDNDILLDRVTKGFWVVEENWERLLEQLSAFMKTCG